MYNEASLQQVHTQQGKLPRTIVSSYRVSQKKRYGNSTGCRAS